MENNNYVTQLFERMYNLSKQGQQGPELLAVLDETREFLRKKIEVDNLQKDPNRAKDSFGTEPVTQINQAPVQELQEFGTPEESQNKGFGSM